MSNKIKPGIEGEKSSILKLKSLDDIDQISVNQSGIYNKINSFGEEDIRLSSNSYASGLYQQKICNNKKMRANISRIINQCEQWEFRNNREKLEENRQNFRTESDSQGSSYYGQLKKGILPKPETLMKKFIEKTSHELEQFKIKNHRSKSHNQRSNFPMINNNKKKTVPKHYSSEKKCQNNQAFLTNIPKKRQQLNTHKITISSKPFGKLELEKEYTGVAPKQNNILNINKIQKSRSNLNSISKNYPNINQNQTNYNENEEEFESKKSKLKKINKVCSRYKQQHQPINASRNIKMEHNNQKISLNQCNSPSCNQLKGLDKLLNHLNNSPINNFAVIPNFPLPEQLEDSGKIIKKMPKSQMDVSHSMSGCKNQKEYLKRNKSFTKRNQSFEMIDPSKINSYQQILAQRNKADEFRKMSVLRKLIRQDVKKKVEENKRNHHLKKRIYTDH